MTRHFESGVVKRFEVFALTNKAKKNLKHKSKVILFSIDRIGQNQSKCEPMAKQAA